jgi:peroxiredoxin
MRHVRYVVADSPFGSFKMIATEQIAKMTSMPEFLCRVLADAFASKIQ